MSEATRWQGGAGTGEGTHRRHLVTHPISARRSSTLANSESSVTDRIAVRMSARSVGLPSFCGSVPAMAHVVFLRAANVGGRNVLRPAQLATALKHLDVVNVGAAGTFLVRERASAATVRQEIQGQLKHDLELAVVPAKEITALVNEEPFRGVTFSKERRAWVAVLCKRPKSKPTLPLESPAGKLWSVRVDTIEGSFALGLYQRQERGFLFPNQVVEKALGVPATTRWWETIVKVAALIER